MTKKPFVQIKYSRKFLLRQGLGCCFCCKFWLNFSQASLNTLRPRWNEQDFADDIFKRIFFNENDWISIKISPKFVPKGPINNIPALVQIMAWRHSGDKPLSEPMMVSLPTHICVTRLSELISDWNLTLCRNSIPSLENAHQKAQILLITCMYIFPLLRDHLTHRGRDKMAATLQMTF